MTRRSFLALPAAQLLSRDMDAPPRTGTYVLTSGRLNAAQHEADEGFYSIGKLTISAPPDGIPALRLRELIGSSVELVVRLRQA